LIRWKRCATSKLSAFVTGSTESLETVPPNREDGLARVSHFSDASTLREEQSECIASWLGRVYFVGRFGAKDEGYD
jgi:hypothetical protein